MYKVVDVPPSIIEGMLPEMSVLGLEPPPFGLMEDEYMGWFEQFRIPGEIDFARALVIGDYGWGSDAPIVLDLRSSPACVRGLVFSPNKEQGGPPYTFSAHWVLLAQTFDEFDRLIGLHEASD